MTEAIAPVGHSPVWCVAANLMANGALDAQGQNLPSGTKHFREGSKVLLIDWSPRDGVDAVAIGRHRKSKQWVKATVPIGRLTTLEVEVIDTAAVLNLVAKHFSGNRCPLTHEFATEMCAALVSSVGALRSEIAEVVLK